MKIRTHRTHWASTVPANLPALLLAAALASACGSHAWNSGGSGASSSGEPSDNGSDAGGVHNFGSGALVGSFGDSGTLTVDAAAAIASGCDPSCAAVGTCSNKVCTVVENPGMIPAATAMRLDAGGKADSEFQWLYPYDGTVFPRGLLPPPLQFAGTAPDALEVRVSFSGFDYTGLYAGANPGRVTFSPQVWTALTNAAKATDTVKVAVTKISGADVSGPITESWIIAQGNLRGTIYYETYLSTLAGLGGVGIMKIQPGASAPTVVKSGCGNVCHTASADGSTLVASTQLPTSASYDLSNGGAALNSALDNKFTYGGLFPDGSVVMSATNYRLWLGSPSRLFDTKSGASIAAPGWDGTITNAGTPAFSPDGSKIAFNHEDSGQGHTLAVMDFDRASKTFSNLVEIANDSNDILAWPAFTPDAKSVVYHAGSSATFETDALAKGDLYIADVATQKATRLDAADGYTPSGTYLPAKDPQLTFAPTVLPEAVGGYFWMVFTSHRSYGNTLPSQENLDENGKLWVAALDMNATPGKDPSHPAFFLTGQELTADNLRGFWVLDPCRKQGGSCASADQCCSGYCRPAAGGTLACTTEPPPGCSQEFEKCTASSDCCGGGFQCINDRCAQPPPPR